MNLRIFVLISLSFELCLARKFQYCELKNELLVKHQIPTAEIYKHLCVVDPSFNTEWKIGSILGIYAIESQWWCGQTAAGGGCNVTCSKLLDDDIADDAACAGKILSQQGVDAWDLNNDDCQDDYANKANDCSSDNETTTASKKT